MVDVFTMLIMESNGNKYIEAGQVRYRANPTLSTFQFYDGSAYSKMLG